MTLKFSAKSFSCDFIFLLNIWVNSAVHSIPKGVYRKNFFVREYVSSSLLIVILRNSFLGFVPLIKISSSVKFLVTSVLNGLKFMSHRRPRNSGCSWCLSGGLMGAWFILLAKCQLIYSCNIFLTSSRFWPTTSLNTISLNSWVKFFAIVYRVHYESIFCLEIN